MAGDWIKMRSDLAEDPAVIGIAAVLGIDEFAVVGRLQVLWAWADAQSRDGHAMGVTGAWIDRKLQRDGFAAAMCRFKWLAITDEGITFPNFENHNGDTGKTRALGKNRKQKQRSGEIVTPDAGDASRTERDIGVTREEKRREELSPSLRSGDAALAPALPKPTPKKKHSKTGMPDDFAVSQRVTDWAAEKGFDRLEQHLESFRMKVAAKGYTYIDWDAAFMEAIREDWAKLRATSAVLSNAARRPTSHSGLAEKNYSAGVAADGTLI